MTWHNDLPRVTSASGLLVRAHDLFSPAYLQYYDRIIATTGVYARISDTLRRFHEKVRVVPNGVDTARFTPHLSGKEVREKHGLEGKVVVLFVGALTVARVQGRRRPDRRLQDLFGPEPRLETPRGRQGLSPAVARPTGLNAFT